MSEPPSMESQARTARKPSRQSGAKEAKKDRETKKDRQFVTALARGLAVLRSFSKERRELGSSQIARLTKLPQPTVWRLCKTLLDEGYLLPTQGGDKFQLSPAVLSLGHSALASVPIAEIAKASMQAISNRFAAGCSLGVRDGRSMLLVQRCQGENATLVLNLHIGSRLPLADSTMGAAYLCALDEPERNALMDEIEAADPAQWPKRHERIKRALREAGKYGYISDSRQFHAQLNTVGVAFKSTDDRIYSLTCGAPSSRLDLGMMRQDLAPELLRLAQTLSGRQNG